MENYLLKKKSLMQLKIEYHKIKVMTRICHDVIEEQHRKNNKYKCNQKKPKQNWSIKKKSSNYWFNS